MASTVPAKSQPLHNFNLPHLKWSKDGQSNSHHQRRRSAKSPLRRPNPSPVSPLRQSPLRDSVSESPHQQSPLRDSASPLAFDSSDKLLKQSKIGGGESSKQSSEGEWMKHSLMGSDSVKNFPIRGDSVRQSSKRELAPESEALGRNRGCLIEYRRNHSRNPSRENIKNGAYASNSERAEEKPGKKQKVMIDGGSTAVNKSKVLIKIPPNNKSEEDTTLEELRELDINDDDRDETRVVEEGKTSNNNDEETKIWNLRPRKPINKCVNMNGDGARVIASVLSDKNKVHSPSRNLTKRSGEIEGNIGGGGEKKAKNKLSVLIALTKEEIEEDIFSMTGSKPARRPKKRAKNIQKQVDFVFPGMWLVSITPDSYKVSENYVKG